MSRIHKRYGWTAGILLTALLLSGCDYANFAILNASSNQAHKISRSSYLWTGISDGTVIISEDDPKDVTFEIEMSEGSLSLTLKNSDGEEIDTLTQEGEYTGTEKFTVEDAGTYKLVQKGKGFNGKYQVTWGTEEETESDSVEN